MKKLLIILLFTFSFIKGQDITFSDLTATTNPTTSWIMPIESPSETYKITLANIYNKLFNSTNEWQNQNTFNYLTRFDSTVQQTGNHRLYNNFTTGWGGTGWQLDYGLTHTGQSTIIVDNMTIRKALYVYDLIARRIYAPNGNLIITSSMKVSDQFTGVDSTLLLFEDPSGNGLSSFIKGDLIRAQKFNPLGQIVRISEAEVDTVYQATLGGLLFPICHVTYREGSTAFQKGDDVVRIGNTIDDTRQSYIYAAADDDYAPFIQFKSGIDSWEAEGDSNNTLVWLGNMDGYTDPDFGELTGGGLFIQDNFYSKNGSLIMNGKGFVRGGKTDYDDTTAGFFIGNSGGEYGVNIGDASNYLKWSAAEGLIVYNSQLDSLDNRLTTAEATIITNTGNIGINTGAIGNNALDINLLWAAVALKASVSFADSTREIADSASAGVIANAGGIIDLNTGFSNLTASLLLYAKKDSLISYINLSPEEIKISADKIVLDGTTIADSLYGKTITGATLQTATSGQRIVIDNANLLSFYGDDTHYSKIEGLYFYSGGTWYNDLIVGDGADFVSIPTDLFISSGEIRIDGHEVATQDWVTSQGYKDSAWVYSQGFLTPTNLSAMDLAWTGSHSWTKSTNNSYYNIVSNTNTGNAALGGFYAKANFAGNQYGVAVQAFSPTYGDANIAGYGRIVADAALNGLILNVGTGKTISFRVNGTQYAGLTSGGLTAGGYNVLTTNSALDPSKVSQTASYRFVTDSEKLSWDTAYTNRPIWGSTGSVTSPVGTIQLTINGVTYKLWYQ